MFRPQIFLLSLCSLFLVELIIVQVDLKRGQRQAKEWQLKRTLFQAEHVTFTD